MEMEDVAPDPGAEPVESAREATAHDPLRRKREGPLRKNEVDVGA